MKVKPVYYDGFVNFLSTPESDEEREALAAMALRSMKAEAEKAAMDELMKKLFEEMKGNE